MPGSLGTFFLFMAIAWLLTAIWPRHLYMPFEAEFIAYLKAHRDRIPLWLPQSRWWKPYIAK